MDACGRRRGGVPSKPLPALRRGVVLGAGLDPALSRRRLFALPERRLGLQPVDPKMAGFEPQRRDAIAAAGIAHHPDKARDAADPAVVAGEPVEFGADVEILALHADHLSASGYRRKQRHLVALTHRVVLPDIFLIDGHANAFRVFERLGIIAAAPAQPSDKPGDVADPRRQWQLFFGDADAGPHPREIQQLHPTTSENGRNSTVSPAARTPVASSRMTSPSACTIDDRIPAPSFGYLTATVTAPRRSSRARRYSRRPGFLR